jgi:26S proteasome regulatory subunit N3
VREGALDQFKKIVTTNKDLFLIFLKDGNYNLINRLRHNVIKFGLRKINLSYNKISLKDVTAKLGLESIQDTECIVAKVNLYTSNEPQTVFDKRIKFCM